MCNNNINNRCKATIDLDFFSCLDIPITFQFEENPTDLELSAFKEIIYRNHENPKNIVVTSMMVNLFNMFPYCDTHKYVIYLCILY